MLIRQLIWVLSFSLLLPSVVLCAQESSPEYFSVKHIKQDFAQLYKDLQLAHFNLFINLPKEQYDREYEQVMQNITSPMTKIEVQLLFQRFVALGDIAHARIDLPFQAYRDFLANGGKSMPLFVSIENSKMYINDYLGEAKGVNKFDELVSIDGISAQQWLSRFSELLSADNARLGGTLIESMLPFLMWLEEGERERFQITLRDNESAVQKTFDIAALSTEQQDAFSQQNEQETQASPEREAKILDNQIAYLKPGPFYNTQSDNVWDSQPFIAFIDNAFTMFKAENAKALLIDLRDNPGGTNSFSDPMIAWFASEPFKFAADFVVKVSPQAEKANADRLAQSPETTGVSTQLAAFYRERQNGERFSFELPLAQPRETERFTAPVYLLINRYSYSNAVSVAAIVKDYGFATILGEKTADLATTLGAMESFTLNHSDIVVGFPKALIVRPNGDERPDGVSPNITLEAPFGPHRQEEMFNQAVAYIKNELQ